MTGVEIELHASRPAMDWDRSRETLMRGSYEHGEALADLLLGMDETHQVGLGRVDPYGDTLFTEQQARAALREIPCCSSVRSRPRRQPSSISSGCCSPARRLQAATCGLSATDHPRLRGAGARVTPDEARHGIGPPVRRSVARCPELEAVLDHAA
ncbi:hypothetical protein [Streptomyces actuosus]|uniref:hypothetical protein n=1 Tax=Streptomyces actuosus TaxID=1885 RepID=UPI001F056D5B|nr:hypothetical protein [Streptomyces actuosus]